MTSIFQKRLHWGAGFIIFLALFFTVFGDKGLIKIIKLHRQISHLKEQKVKLKKHNIKLSETIQKMKHERTFQERSARESLGMVQDNEIIYEFQK